MEHRKQNRKIKFVSILYVCTTMNKTECILSMQEISCPCRKYIYFTLHSDASHALRVCFLVLSSATVNTLLGLKP